MAFLSDLEENLVNMAETWEMVLQAGQSFMLAVCSVCLSPSFRTDLNNSILLGISVTTPYVVFFKYQMVTYILIKCLFLLIVIVSAIFC